MKKKERITSRVCELRQDENVTQQELADNVGVSRQTIIAIEKGNYMPSVGLALRIAAFFGVQVEDIFSIT